MTNNFNISLIYLLCSGMLFIEQYSQALQVDNPGESRTYTAYVQECMDILMEYGTDRYGEVHTPMLVSILDVETRSCPANPEALDEYFRVTRRERRNPAGSNLLTDQATLKTMYMLSVITGKADYASFADRYTRYVQHNLVDEANHGCVFDIITTNLVLVVFLAHDIEVLKVEVVIVHSGHTGVDGFNGLNNAFFQLVLFYDHRINTQAGLELDVIDCGEIGRI